MGKKWVKSEVFMCHPYSFSINFPLVDEFVYDLLADFGYSNTDRKGLCCVYWFHFLT